MATPREVRSKLESLSADDRTAFDDAFPYDGQSRSPAGYERLFYDQPDLEGTFCRLLGLASEGEKVTQASLDSAEAAKLCAQASLDSARWARVAGVCSLVALGVSVASLFR